MNTQDWSPLGWTCWISLQSKGLSRVFSNTIVQKPILRCSAFFTVQLSHPYMTTGKTIALTRRTFVGKVMSLLFKQNLTPSSWNAFGGGGLVTKSCLTFDIPWKEWIQWAQMFAFSINMSAKSLNKRYLVYLINNNLKVQITRLLPYSLVPPHPPPWKQGHLRCCLLGFQSSEFLTFRLWLPF